MPKISIITPWLNASELTSTYRPSVRGAEVIVIDNGSEQAHADIIRGMAEQLEGVYIRNKHNAGFSAANNQGLAVATGDIVVFMNNDVECQTGWLQKVIRDVGAGEIVGPSMLSKHGVKYLEGYCIAARRDVWQALGGWPEDLPGMYWEDNILCLRAVDAGYTLKQAAGWGVWHFNNYTSRKTPGAYDHSAANERVFLDMIHAHYNRGK